MKTLLTELNIPHQVDAPLGPLTWYGVGGSASVLARPESIEQLSTLATRCHQEGVAVYMMGRGANLLVRDQGVQGVVVKLDHPAFCHLDIDDRIVTVGAGYDLAKLVLTTAKAGLAGLEVLAGVPATVGGAIRMNAGGAFGDIGQSVRRVRVMDGAGEIYDRDRDDLVFEYRQTNIVARYILEAEFELEHDDADALVRRVKEIFLFKKNTQPLAENSAGCAFKNPVVNEATQTRESAGKLIDSAGLKGYRHGGAHVSEHHANFIAAGLGAKADDVLAVMTHVEEVVAKRFGVKLQREVVIWP